MSRNLVENIFIDVVLDRTTLGYTNVREQALLISYSYFLGS
jgi:hypothetical protein